MIRQGKSKTLIMASDHPDAAGTACVVVADPCHYYPNMTMGAALSAGGFIIPWAVSAQEGETMAAAIERQYPFYSGQLQGGTVNRERVYTYPDDPPLYPYFSVMNPDTLEELLFYPAGIVAIIHHAKTDARPDWVARCD